MAIRPLQEDVVTTLYSKGMLIHIPFFPTPVNFYETVSCIAIFSEGMKDTHSSTVAWMMLE